MVNAETKAVRNAAKEMSTVLTTYKDASVAPREDRIHMRDQVSHSVKVVANAFVDFPHLRPEITMRALRNTPKEDLPRLLSRVRATFDIRREMRQVRKDHNKRSA